MINCMETVIYYFLASLFIIEPIIKIWFHNQIFSICYLYGSIGLILYTYQLYKNKQFRLTWRDVLLGMSVLYNLPEILKFDYLPIVISFFAIYLLTKSSPNKHKFTYILTASGILQILLMYTQWKDIISWNNGAFPITGSFDNPGPLGGYLAICFIATLGNSRNMNKWLCIICTFTIGIGLIISDSRAAWLATLVALLYMALKPLHIGITKKLFVSISLITVFIVLSLSTYKTNSAKGRLLIWEISAEMIKKHPLCGSGLTSYRSDYMEYQADYIHKNPNFEKNKLLSNNGFAFNEFLHIIYEQGIIGILFIAAILTLLYLESIRQNTFSFLCLITLIVFSCFSYPTEVFLLFITSALIMGTISDNYPINHNYLFSLRKIAMFICISTLIVISYQWRGRLKLEKALVSYLYRDDLKSLNYIQDHYTQIKNCSDFLFRYSRILYLKGEYHSAIPAVKQAIYLYPTTDKYCDLGDIYQHLNQNKKAEQAYKYAIHLMPYLVYPNYCLFLLYKETGQKEKALKEANHIINMPHKIENHQYKEIIHLIKQYLDNTIH